jgi:hypothetical protein
LKNHLHIDLDSHDDESAQHAGYDEGMNNVADPPPNAFLDRFSQRGEPFPPRLHLLILMILDLDMTVNHFQDLRTLSVPATGEDSRLGFVFSE